MAVIKVKPGDKITKGPGWRLTATKGVKRVFKDCTVLSSVNDGATRLVVLRVPKK